MPKTIAKSSDDSSNSLSETEPSKANDTLTNFETDSKTSIRSFQTKWQGLYLCVQYNECLNKMTCALCLKNGKHNVFTHGTDKRCEENYLVPSLTEVTVTVFEFY